MRIDNLSAIGIQKGFKLGYTVDQSDQFLDSVAQALNIIDPRGITVSYLRNLYDRIASDDEKHSIQSAIKTGNAFAKSIIRGKIICKHFGVNLHVTISHEIPLGKCICSTLLLGKDGDIIHAFDWNDKFTIHLLSENYLTFLPIVPENQEQVQLTDGDESKVDERLSSMMCSVNICSAAGPSSPRIPEATIAREHNESSSMIIELTCQNRHRHCQSFFVDNHNAPKALYNFIGSHLNSAIVKIICCNCSQVNSIMTQTFYDILRRMDNLTFIDIVVKVEHVGKGTFLGFGQDLLNNVDRTFLIVQCCSCLKNAIYYRNSANQIKRTSLITGDVCNFEQLKSQLLRRDFDLSSIVDSLKLNLFGNISETDHKSLLEVRMSHLQQLALIYFAVKSDILILKYLLLVVNCNVNIVQLFGVNQALPIGHTIVQELNTAIKTEFASAIESGRMVDNVNEIYLLLLKADVPFPDTFRNLDQLDNLNISDNIMQLANQRNGLHTLILSARCSECLELIETLGQSQLFLNTSNDSALYTAIKNDQFDIYARLLANKLKFRNNEEERALGELSGEKRCQLREAIDQLSPVSKTSIVSYLASISKKARSIVDDDCFEKFKSYYNQLFEIEEIAPILEVVHYCDHLEIFFDYENRYVCYMHPFALGPIVGLTNSIEKRIFIGAHSEESELLATIAHELTHLAMQMLYQNYRNPYKSDNVNKYVFSDIVGNLYTRWRNGELDDSWNIIFNRIERDRAEEVREAIVQVPEMLVKLIFNGDVNELEAKYAELYQYYKNVVLLECKHFIANSHLLKMRGTITALNNCNCFFNTINRYDVRFENSFQIPNDEQDKQLFLLATPSTLLTVLSVCQFLASDILLLHYENFLNQEDEALATLKFTICKALVIELNTVVVTTELISTIVKLIQFFNGYPSKRIFLVVHESIQDCVRERVSSLSQDRHTNRMLSTPPIERYSLNGMHDSSKQKLLKRYVYFQDEQVMINHLVDANCEACLDLVGDEILAKLIKRKRMKFSQKPLLSDGYNEESFRIDSQQLSNMDLVRQLNRHSVILVNNNNTSGKSALLSQMSQKGNWLIIVDVPVLNGGNSAIGPEHVADAASAVAFFIDNMASCTRNSKVETDFEKSLLKHRIVTKNNVIVMFDKYNELVINLIAALSETQMNEIWTANRIVNS